VFSIEAFVHSPEPAAFFRAAARCVVPGGLLVICDDVLSGSAREGVSSGEQRLLNEFRYGWAAPSLSSHETMSAAAESCGFHHLKSLDLTPNLELDRPRDRLVRAIMTVGRYLPIRGYRWRSLLGGNALQIAVASGLIEYRFNVWRREA